MTERKPTVRKIVTSSVAVKKESNWSRFKNDFFAGDFETIATNYIWETAVPRAFDYLYEITLSLVDVIFRKNTNGRRTVSRNSSVPASRVSYVSSNTNYNKISSPNQSQSRASEVIDRSVADYEQLVFKEEDDANDVLNTMRAICEQYNNRVSLGTMYELAGKTCPFTYESYGWYGEDLVHAYVAKYGYNDGFYIVLPRFKPFNK